MSEMHAQLRDALAARFTGAEPARAWADLHEAGVVGLRVPAALGGLELGIADAEPVFDVLGEFCAPTSYLETSVIAAGLLTALRSEAGDAWLARIADGARVAVAGIEPLPLGIVRATQAKQTWRLNGEARIVLDAMDADGLLVIAEAADGAPRLFLVKPGASGLAKRAVPTLDGRMAADLTFADVEAGVPLSGDVAAALSLVRDEALACICLEAAGLMRRLVRDTVAYMKQREQFGQSLGAFQVVQHRLVDMNIQARRAGAIARRALASLDADEITRQRATSAAKVAICKAGRFVGQNAVQLHGGMGMTAELAVGRCFKRLTVIESQLGSADYHLRRFQRLRTLTN